MTPVEASWAAENAGTLAAAALGLVSTVFGIVWTRRGNREVQQLSAEEGAYTRASEIDRGVVARLEGERDYLSGALEDERRGRREDAEQHAREKAAWAAERADLERRVRELLDEVVDLGRRHGIHADEDATPTA